MGQLNPADFIRNISDFPIPGIQFKDITPLLRNGPAFHHVVETFVEHYRGRTIDVVVGVESRGFIFSAPLAYELGVGLAPIRKQGKLPADIYHIEYELEYGSNSLELHRDAIDTGAKVLIVDDLLATGGTIAAASRLVEQAGGVIEELAFVIELTFLNGREHLKPYSIYSLIQY